LTDVREENVLIVFSLFLIFMVFFKKCAFNLTPDYLHWTFEEYVHLVGFMQICTSFLPLCCDSIKNTYNNQTKKNKYYTLD
jgi:hypothetical protein